MAEIESAEEFARNRLAVPDDCVGIAGLMIASRDNAIREAARSQLSAEMICAIRDYARTTHDEHHRYPELLRFLQAKYAPAGDGT